MPGILTSWAWSRGADGGDEAVGVDAGKDGDGEPGADAGDGEETLEEALFVEVVETVEGELIFGDLGEDVEFGFGALARESGKGGDGDGDVVAYAGALEQGLRGGFGEEGAAEVGDHVRKRLLARVRVGCKTYAWVELRF